MKNYSYVTGFILFIFSFSSCHHNHTISYEHELGVITNPRMYYELVKENPMEELVDLKEYIPGIELDIRYGTKNNFTKHKIYNKSKAYLRLPAAEALLNVQQELKKMGLGLKVFDAYRPYSATVKFYEVYPDTNFVAAPWNGSRHNRGCAVDVTLINLETREELDMPTVFDDFTKNASHDFMDLSDNVIKNRQILRDIMIRHKFSIYLNEWWHYDFIHWKEYKLLDINFDDIEFQN